MIELNSEWAISADEYNITLFHKKVPRKTGGKVSWKKQGYYTTLHGVYKGLVAQEVRSSGLITIQDLISRLDKIHAFIESLPNFSTQDFIKERRTMSAETKAKIKEAKRKAKLEV
jgi:hypothetical protein